MRFFRRRKPAAKSTPAPDQQPRFVIREGRRFDTAAPYALPTDLTEDNRLDFQHYMIRYIMQGNYRSPLSIPKDILDVGTSTGLWAYEMARQFPDANVVGLDKDQPTRDRVQQMSTPENYLYVEHNIFTDGYPTLPFANETFDFIHQRLLIAAIPEQMWQSEVQELARVARRGGWIELVESTFIRQAGPGLTTISQMVGSAVAKLGINFATSEHLEDFLRGAGLQDVKQEVLEIPFGAWGGRLGIMMQQDYLAVFGSLKAHVLRFAIATPELWDRNWNMALAETTNPTIHAVVPIIIAYGQRAS